MKNSKKKVGKTSANPDFLALFLIEMKAYRR
jgi:hypothetical protein